MIKKTLGRTGLEVTQLGFGAMEIRGERIWSGRPVEDTQADTILNAVLDAGINFIDTSNDYGKSEYYIGRFISKRRGEYYLATKCGCTIVNKGDHDDTPHVWTRENLLRNIDESLSLMKTDYVDVWQIHNAPADQILQEDLISVMKEVQEAGKTRFLGVSTTLPHLLEYVKTGVFDTFQIPYSLLERHEENSITIAADAGAGIIVRGGIGQGAPGESARDKKKVELWDEAKLDDLLNGMSKAEFILRFTLTHPHCHTTIVGTLNPDHLRDNIAAAANGPLGFDLYEEAKRRMDEIGHSPADLSEFEY